MKVLLAKIKAYLYRVVPANMVEERLVEASIIAEGVYALVVTCLDLKESINCEPWLTEYPSKDAESHLTELCPRTKEIQFSYGEWRMGPAETETPPSVVKCFEGMEPGKKVVILTTEGGMIRAWFRGYVPESIQTNLRHGKTSKWTGETKWESDWHTVNHPYYGEIPLETVNALAPVDNERPVATTPTESQVTTVVPKVYTTPISLMTRDELEKVLSLKKGEMGRLRGGDKGLALKRLDELIASDDQRTEEAVVVSATLHREPEKAWSLADLASLQKPKQKKRR